MTRRGILKMLIGAAAAGITGAAYLPARVPPHTYLLDGETGIAIRYVQQYDLEAAQALRRFDVIAVNGVWHIFDTVVLS